MMISIDKRLNENEMDILRLLIGRKIVSLRHNKYCPVHLHAAFGVVGIETEQGMIYLYSETDSMNYFGSVEYETVLTLSHERHAWLDYDESKRFFS